MLRTDGKKGENINSCKCALTRRMCLKKKKEQTLKELVALGSNPQRNNDSAKKEKIRMFRKKKILKNRYRINCCTSNFAVFQINSLDFKQSLLKSK